MFLTLKYKFQSLKHKFQSLKYKFQTLKHKILLGVKTFFLRTRRIVSYGKIIFLCSIIIPFRLKLSTK